MVELAVGVLDPVCEFLPPSASSFRIQRGPVEGLARLSVIVAASLLFWAGLLVKSGRAQPLAPTAIFLTVTGGAAVITGGQMDHVAALSRSRVVAPGKAVDEIALNTRFFGF